MNSWMKKALCPALLLGMAASVNVHAQTYPARPITVLFPFPPGPDLALRILSGALEKSFGQPIVIDYRTGGDEIPLMQGLLNGAADGYTIGSPSQNFAVNPVVHKLPYQQTQFQPITKFASWATPMLVRNDFPAKTVPEFIAYAKANPGKINLASIGAYNKISFNMLEKSAGIQFTQVPFRGGPDIIAAIASGQIDVMFINLTQALPLVKDNKAKMMAVTGEKRMTEIPDVPAVAETVPGWNITYWFGLVAKAGTPRPVVDRWSNGVRDAFKQPEVLKAFQNGGYTPVSQTPEEMSTAVRNQTELLGAAAKAAGITPE